MDVTGSATQSLPAILMDRMDDVAGICREDGVRHLYVFGSAVHGTFDPETNDLDFMVDLGEYEPTIARRYVRFYEAPRNVLDPDIDLITTRPSGGRGSLEDAPRDALDASTGTLSWSDGKSLTDHLGDKYMGDKYMQSATERPFEIPGEALNLADRSDPTLRQILPEVGEIIGTRNAIAHAYFRIDDDLIWSAIFTEIPPVRDRLLELLGPDADPSYVGA